MLRVAYQGTPGAYSEEAVRVFWDSSAVAVPMREFTDVVAAVDEGHVEAAVLPVENSRTGVIGASRDALLSRPELVVLLETGISIRHQLLGIPGASIETLRRVASHVAALDQCRDWFSRHPHLEPVIVNDTAGAAREVAQRNDDTFGAIASAAAGVRYGLSVLARDLQDDPMNRTRFWAVARAPLPVTVARAWRGVRTMNGVTVRTAFDRLIAELASQESTGANSQDEDGRGSNRCVGALPGHGGKSYGLA